MGDKSVLSSQSRVKVAKVRTMVPFAVGRETQSEEMMLLSAIEMVT